MVNSELWDLNSIKVSIQDQDYATIDYQKDTKYVYSSDKRREEVCLNFIDTLIGRKITDKVMIKLKELVVRLEKENEGLKELIKWEEDFNKQRK